MPTIPPPIPVPGFPGLAYTPVVKETPAALFIGVGIALGVVGVITAMNDIYAQKSSERAAHVTAWTLGGTGAAVGLGILAGYHRQALAAVAAVAFGSGALIGATIVGQSSGPKPGDFSDKEHGQ